MDEIKFASFKPLMAMGDQSKEQIQNYYTDNNIAIPNDYLKRYLGLDKELPSTESTETKSKYEKFNVKDILSNLKRPTIDEPQVSESFVPVSDRAKTAMNFFMKKGMTKEVAAGIVGNLQSESGLNPEIEGDKNLPTSSKGIAQWREGRLENLKNFAKKSGRKYTDFNTQLEFLWNELQGSENAALRELTKSKDPVTAARVFANKFERMKKYGKEREINASRFYKI